MSRGFLRLPLLILLLRALQTFSPARLHAQQWSTPPAENSALEGQRIFATSCAACHGLDARGGERAPDITNKKDAQDLSDEALLRIIHDGIAGTGMPAFRSMETAQIQAVVRHLRSLQGQATPVELPGDPESGKALFFGKPGCSQCHMANGEGGFIASDLSSSTGARSADDLRSAINDPNKNLDPRKGSVVVTTMNGKTQIGMARNEDNFSLQIQALDGTFHMFTKSELRSVEYQARSLMPADYGSSLSRQQLDDLVSYLMSIRRTNNQRPTGKQ
jgi:cytochrome c oxidase cbb3-type subunit 3